MARRYHVFVNDEAGSVNETDRQTAEITEAFREHGVEVTTVAIDAQLLPAAMREAWTPGIDAIVVAGGDGTVNCAAQVAVDHDIVLGALPMGTFNHFAKDLGMPDDLSGAVQFLSQAEVASVDVGEVNGRVFVNNASIGVYPKVVDERDAIRARRGWGKVRAAPVAIARTLRRLPVHRLRVALDGSPPLVIATPLLFVGNGLFDDRGLRVGKRTSLSDHRLAVYVIATTSPWRLIGNALRARFGGVEAAPHMDRRVAEGLVIDSDERSLEIALDGEPTDLQVPLTFRSRARALRVLAAPPRSEVEDHSVRLGHMSLGDEKYIALTTFKRDGTPVTTAVWAVPVDDGKVGFWTSSGSGKAKRLTHTSKVIVQPSNSRGVVKPGSTPIEATAVLVTGPDLEGIRAKVNAKYGVMVPISKIGNKIGEIVKRKKMPYGDRGVVITPN